MKKKVIIISIALVLLITTAIICVLYFVDKKPFRNLSTDDVYNVAVVYGVKSAYLLNEEEREEFISLLNEIVIKNRTTTDKEIYYGAFPPVIYLDSVDGNVTRISFYETPDRICLFINDKLYNTKHEECKKLQEYCTNIIKKYILDWEIE